MKKLLVITSNIAPYRLRWEEELAKYYDVTIAYTKDKEAERKEGFLKHASDICHVVKLNNPEDKDDPVCFDVLKLIKEHKDSFILFDGYGLKTNLLGMLYAKFRGMKRYVNVDGYALGEPVSKIKDFVKHIIIKYFCSDFFCSSELTKEHLIEYGAKRDRILVHNFSSICDNQILDKPLRFEEKLKIREKLNIKSDKKLIIAVGNFIPRKRFEDLIKALVDSDIKADLLFLGGRPTEEYLKLINNDPRVLFADFVPPEMVDDYYKAADLFVLPSQTDVWGLVINEAMAKGLPVISSDHCIAGLTMVNDNGVVYPTGDIDSLREALRKCLDDENNRPMSLKSLEIIHSYTIEEMVKRQVPVIDSYFETK